jgi:serine carboxypeptidase-like clade 1
VGSCGGAGDAQHIEVENYFRHNMIDDALYQSIITACKDWDNPSSECGDLLDQMDSVIGSFNVYDIYDDCSNGDSQPPKGCPNIEYHPFQLQAKKITRTARRAPKPHWDRKNIRTDHACQDIDAGQYLDFPIVREAIHVVNTSIIPNFQLCAQIDYDGNIASLLPGYPQLIAAMRVLIFSGDSDACIPYVGTQWWTSTLASTEGYKVKTAWKSWQVDSQVGGYVMSYTAPNDSEFTFLTIKASGHMVK